MNEAVDAVVGEVVNPKVEEPTKPITNATSEPEKVVEVEIDKVKDTKDEKQSDDLNAQFASVRRKAEQEAKDKLVKELGKHFKWDEKLDSYDAIMDAIKEQEIAKKAEETGADPEVIRENEQLKEENKKYKAEKAKQQDYVDFKKKFPKVEFNAVPKEIWTKVQAGGNLKALYTEYALDQLLLKDVKDKEVEEVNKSNEKATTGSVKGKETTSGDGYITQSEFDAHKEDRSWMQTNYKRIMKSFKNNKLKNT